MVKDVCLENASGGNNRMVVKLLLAIVFTILACPINADDYSSNAADFKLDPDALNRARGFLDAISTGNIDDAFRYLDNGSLAYRSNVMYSNKTIKGKEEFVKLYPVIFNEKLHESLKHDTKRVVSLYGAPWRSSYAWDNGELFNVPGQIIIWFDASGIPVGVMNASMVLPSFDCERAANRTEKIICTNVVLADLDVELNQAYTRANKMLTGDDLKELKANQIDFIKERNRCNDDKVCIRSVIFTRMKQIDQQIQDEIRKPDPAFGDEEVDIIDGYWISKEYIDTADCYNGGDFDALTEASYSVIIKYPYVIIGYSRKGIKDSYICKVDENLTTSYAKLYFETVYEENYWGSCGGDIDIMPYRGKYTSLRLASLDRKEMKDDRAIDCGYLVLSNDELGRRSLIYGKEPIDKNLLGSGYVLEKKSSFE